MKRMLREYLFLSPFQYSILYYQLKYRTYQTLFVNCHEKLSRNCGDLDIGGENIRAHGVLDGMKE